MRDGYTSRPYLIFSRDASLVSRCRPQTTARSRDPQSRVLRQQEVAVDRAPSLGSRWYLRRARVGATTRSAWDRAQHEPRKQPLRQRIDGNLLQHRTEAHDDWKRESNQTRIELADASEMDIIILSTKVKQAQAHATPSQLLASPLASNSVWRAVHVLVLWRAHVSDLRRP